MRRIEITSNETRLARQPGPSEAVVITRYGKPEFVVLRWEDFASFEALLDRYLTHPPHDLVASDLAVRAEQVDDRAEADDVDFDSLGKALGE
jgi:PHD/YefM family antitoxin component YafN of YafNO toxin-antitoxin module